MQISVEKIKLIVISKDPLTSKLWVDEKPIEQLMIFSLDGEIPANKDRSRKVRNQVKKANRTSRSF